MSPRKEWRAIRIRSFSPKLGYFTDQNRLKGGSHEMEFWLFSNTKWRRRNGFIYLVSMFPSRFIVLKLSEKVRFWQFCADLNKKTNYVQVIFIYASESSRYTQKMTWFIAVWATFHEMSAMKISNKMLTKQKSKFRDLKS